MKDPSSNPYALGDGVKYYMLEVEDWTQPAQQNRRRVSSRKVPAENGAKDSTTPPPNLPPGPPEAEVEDSFHVTHSPTSHLFPVRSRSNSNPNAGRSSLSRLLAQASTDNNVTNNNVETTPVSATKSPSPPTSPPQSPTHTGSGPQSYVPHVQSPLRPGSRASRMSVSSRFSVSRLPPFGSASSGSPGAGKAAATTALSEEEMPTSRSPVQPASPSPEGSISEGMSNHLLNRRRTTSYHVPRASRLATSSTVPYRSSTASSTLAHLANSWGVSFGRKRKAELSNVATSPTAAESSKVDASGTSHIANESSARDLLQKF
jgi:autophagy-related protein 11